MSRLPIFLMNSDLQFRRGVVFELFSKYFDQ